MTQIPEEAPLPPSLRFLKTLVILLMLCMIGGVITVSALLVTRLKSPPPTALTLPDHLALPAGERARAVTLGDRWIAVVTESDKILIYTPEGKLSQEVAITLPEEN